MRFIVALIALSLVFADQCQADTSIGCNFAGPNCVTERKCPQYTDGYSTGEVWKYTCIGNKWESTTCIQLPPKNFKYPQDEIEMLKDQPMIPITPTVECYQCKFKVRDEIPAFPAGVNFQDADGTISGTPTVLMEKTTYTIIARAEDAATDAEFQISMVVVTESANYTLTIIVVIVVVILLAIFGTCLFFRLRGTGRATRKGKQLRSAGGAKGATTRV